MLSNYQIAVRRLLQNPAAPTSLYDADDVNSWINIARGQMAGEAECIRLNATVSTVIGQQEYNFSSLNTGSSATNGIAGAIHVRSISYAVGTGWRKIPNRPWTWFNQYFLNDAVPESGPPVTWAQFGQGAAAQPANTGATGGGTFWIAAIPDAVYTLRCDCVCFPIPLVADNTVEAIPYLWTDAVPFFAAYYALLSAQTSARTADAERMYNYYETFLERARRSANPNPLRWQYEQASDPTQAAKIGLKASAG